MTSGHLSAKFHPPPGSNL